MGTGVRKYVKAILNLLTAVALLLLAVLLLPWLLRFFMPFVIGWIIAASLSLFFYRAVKQQRFDIPPTDIRLETAEEAAQAQWVQREA